MAAIIKNSLIPLIFSALIIHGLCECSLNNINMGTMRSGRAIGGKSEWEVNVINNCNCSQSQIRLSCMGFQSSETIDPSILSKIEGDVCLLINGNSLNPFSSVKFSYAWDPPFLFLPSASVLDPSCL